jgi:hypothetical protein
VNLRLFSDLAPINDLAKEVGRPSVYSQTHSARLMRAAPFFALPIRRVKSPQARDACDPDYEITACVALNYRRFEEWKEPFDVKQPLGQAPQRSRSDRKARQGTIPMKSAAKVAARKPDRSGIRERCIGCGHPRGEHRTYGCTVPRCSCHQWSELTLSENELS